MKFLSIRLALLTIFLTAGVAFAQMQHASAPAFVFYPDAVDYDPAIPTLQQVVGHAWGESITSPDEIGRYLEAVAAASPRVQLHEYARTWEGRPLWYVVVGSEANVARIEQIRTDNLALADPRNADEARAQAIIAANPTITWIAAGVHGNEISSTDAVLLMLYHLAAARDDALADEVLANSVVIFDPMQNPDGRNRFVSFYRGAKGMWPDASPAAAENNEPWPGGRTNHYLFDLNRDWFAQTQPETRGKIAAFMHWRPQVYVDLHEMGGDSTYYFPPQADPLNPNLSPDVMKWITEIGRNNATWFDRMGFDYFSREVFDSYYPGYGASWPTHQGAMGMTYEQASSRGLLAQRSDDTVLVYRDTVHQHYIASLSTAQAAARNREAILRDFWRFGVDNVADGATDEMREIIIDPSRDPARADRLVSVLMAQGVEVARASEPFANVVGDYFGGAPQRREFPAGSYRISMAQPARRLIKSLLARDTTMDAEFVREQMRRYARREGDQIYDITAWSLPLLFDLDAWIASEPSTTDTTLGADMLTSPPARSAALVGKAAVAYLVPWGTRSAAEGLAMLHRHGIRVHSAGDAFSIGGRDYPAGSLIVKVHDNDDSLHDTLAMIAQHHGVDIHPTDTSQVTAGINFGSGQVRYLPKPRVALAWDSPTSSNSAGWARYLLEGVYRTPVTAIRVQQLGRADLDDFNVLVLPDAGGFGGGGYGSSIDEDALGRIRDWVRDGGTLVTIGGATRWAADEEVALLATKRKLKQNPEGVASPAGEDAPDTGLPPGVYPEEEEPSTLPGPLLRARLDGEHWLASGYGERVSLIAQSRNIWELLTIDDGANVVTYLPLEELLVAGVAWQPELELIAGSPYLMHQGLGAGHIVAFAEDPNFRAYFDGLNLLFMNAIFLGPGY